MSQNKSKNFIVAIIPIVFLITLLFFNVIVFGDETLSGSNQMILLMSAFMAVLIGVLKGVKWKKINKAVVGSIDRSMSAILILLMIGALAGSWLLSGIVPTMIFYGLKIIHPKVFLLTAVVISGIISFATGSSWSTIATMGIALLGIGKTLGFHEGLVAGAIISGAYFGDKMSPLSDTTNLASAIAGADLFVHIRYMLLTTAPSISIACIIFTIIGFNYSAESLLNIDQVSIAIKEKFNVNPLLFVTPFILLVIIIKKVPALPALFIGTLLGAISSIVFQGSLLKTMMANDQELFFGTYQLVLQSMFGETNIETSNTVLSDLFSSGGMAGMLHTVWLILAAMVFGGCMEAAGLLQTITNSIVNMAKSTGSIILSTILSSIFLNFTASDQYIAIVIPGRMYADSYKKRGLKPEVLSRTLEDGGTLTSVLVPWNTCGATQAKVLGVSTLAYLPYCFFNIVNPIVAVIIAYSGYKIRKVQQNANK